jgi:3-deoxy-D-manno-octulosonic-acid transferase
MTPEARTDRPLIWAHANTPAAIDAIRDVLMRAQLSDPTLSYVLTTSDSAVTFAPDIVVLDEADAEAGLAWLSETSPDLCLWAQASVASALFGLNHRRSIPTLLINAETRPLWSRTWLWRKTILRQTLKPVFYAFVTSGDSTGSLRNLGLPARNIEVLGPLLGGVLAPGCDEGERDRIGEILAGRPVWFAHRVPHQEMRVVIDAFMQVQRKAHRMLLILDLLDPACTEDCRALCAELGLTTHARAEEGEPDSRTQVFLAETGEDTGLWYRLAALAYMGGSLTSGDVPNPMVAAALGSAVVHGPEIGRNQHAYDRLREAGAAQLLATAQDLSRRVAAVMEPDQCAEMAAAGWEVVSEGAEVTDRLVEVTLQKLGLGETQ